MVQCRLPRVVSTAQSKLRALVALSLSAASLTGMRAGKAEALSPTLISVPSYYTSNPESFMQFWFYSRSGKPCLRQVGRRANRPHLCSETSAAQACRMPALGWAGKAWSGSLVGIVVYAKPSPDCLRWQRTVGRVRFEALEAESIQLGE